MRSVPIGCREIPVACLEVTRVDPPPKKAQVEDETEAAQRRIKTLEAESSGLRALHGISLFADFGVDGVDLTCPLAERGVAR